MSLDHNSGTDGASSNRALGGGCYQGNGGNMTSDDARDDPLHELDVPAVGNKDLRELCVAILTISSISYTSYSRFPLLF
jgi:hypothetical protein